VVRLILIAFLVFSAQIVTAQKTISFATSDGGLIYADVCGTSDRAVILAHGGEFNKESWAKQAQILVAAGFQVLASIFEAMESLMDRAIPMF
jgi:hypothetical protein